MAAGQPILNLILDDLTEAVKDISASGNYAVTLEAEDRAEPYNVAEDMKAVVFLDDSDPEIIAEDTSGDSGFVTWRQPVKIVCVVVNPEVANPPPADRLIIRVWADIVKAVMVDRGRGDHAQDTIVRPPTFGNNGVVARFAIDYQTRVDDPTRQD